MINNLQTNSRDLNVKPITLRRQEIIPGVVYGPDLKTSLPIQISKNELKRALSQDTEIFQIKAANQNLMVKFDEIQQHPVSHAFVHFSLVQMNRNIKTHIDVPLHVVGESKGQKAGGMIVILKDHLPLFGMPQDIPGHIDFDVTELEVGDNVHVKDIKLSSGLTIDLEADFPVISCRPPHKEEPATETSTEAIAEEDAADKKED